MQAGYEQRQMPELPVEWPRTKMTHKNPQNRIKNAPKLLLLEVEVTGIEADVIRNR
jgi:hypothetical protein